MTTEIQSGNWVNPHPPAPAQKPPRSEVGVYRLAARQSVQQRVKRHPDDHNPDLHDLCRHGVCELGDQCLLGAGVGKPQAVRRWALPGRSALAARRGAARHVFLIWLKRRPLGQHPAQPGNRAGSPVSDARNHSSRDTGTDGDGAGRRRWWPWLRARSQGAFPQPRAGVGLDPEPAVHIHHAQGRHRYAHTWESNGRLRPSWTRGCGAA